jgi:hypothetical protein
VANEWPKRQRTIANRSEGKTPREGKKKEVNEMRDGERKRSE